LTGEPVVAEVPLTEPPPRCKCILIS